MSALRRTLCRPTKLTNLRVKQLQSILKNNFFFFFRIWKKRTVAYFKSIPVAIWTHCEFWCLHCRVILLNATCIILPILPLTPGAKLCTWQQRLLNWQWLCRGKWLHVMEILKTPVSYVRWLERTFLHTNTHTHTHTYTYTHTHTHTHTLSLLPLSLFRKITIELRSKA